MTFLFESDFFTCSISADIAKKLKGKRKTKILFLLPLLSQTVKALLWLSAILMTIPIYPVTGFIGKLG